MLWDTRRTNRSISHPCKAQALANVVHQVAAEGGRLAPSKLRSKAYLVTCQMAISWVWLGLGLGIGANFKRS